MSSIKTFSNKVKKEEFLFEHEDGTLENLFFHAPLAYDFQSYQRETLKDFKFSADGSPISGTPSYNFKTAFLAIVLRRFDEAKKDLVKLAVKEIESWTNEVVDALHQRASELFMPTKEMSEREKEAGNG